MKNTGPQTMLYDIVCCETYNILSQTQSSADLYSFCFKDTETVFTTGYAVEPSSSETDRDCTVYGSHTQTIVSACPTSIQDGSMYHQGPGHETDHCTTLRHAIQDLIDQGLVHLGEPSVTINPLSAHTTHVVPPLTDGIHFLDFAKLDDHIHMLSQDDSELKPIASDEIYEISQVNLSPQMPTPFRLVPEAMSIQTTIVAPPTFPHYSAQTPFVLISGVEEVRTSYVDDVHIFDIQYVICGGRVVRQQPPTTARPLEGTSSHEEVKREDDEILKLLQNTQARIFIWRLLASSNTHRDALI